jgi:hypothetical protein
MMRPLRQFRKQPAQNAQRLRCKKRVGGAGPVSRLTLVSRLVVVYLSAAPGPIRSHYRQKINALVYQALVE